MHALALRGACARNSRAAEYKSSGRRHASKRLLIRATFGWRGCWTKGTRIFTVFRANVLVAPLKQNGIRAVFGFGQLKSPENIAHLSVCSRGEAMRVFQATLDRLLRITCKAAAHTSGVTRRSVRAALWPWAFGNGKVRNLQPALAPIFVDYTRRRARRSS